MSSYLLDSKDYVVELVYIFILFYFYFVCIEGFEVFFWDWVEYLWGRVGWWRQCFRG